MAEYDLAVRSGLLANGFGTTRCDIGIRGGRIVALAERITDARAVVEAGGLLVLPGGVDSHCHIEEPARGGYTGPKDGAPPPVTVQEESFGSASASAFAGGTKALMQHAIDYTPYEGLEATGWPVATLRRGVVVMQDGVVQAEPGTGQFLPRGPYEFIAPRGVLADGFDAAPPSQ